MASSLFTGHIPRPSHLLLRNKALTIASSAAAVILGLIAAIHPDWLLELDRPVSRAIRGESLEGFFRFWTKLGSQQDMAIVAVVLALFLWRRCKSFSLTFPVAIAAGIILDVSLKLIVDRPRPAGSLVDTALGSFPSGHALTGVIFFGLLPPAIWIAFRRRLLFWASVPLAAIVGLLVVISRVYLGAHWPSDVVASLFIGASVLLLAEYGLASRLAGRHCDGCPLHRAHTERGPDHKGASRTTQRSSS